MSSAPFLAALDQLRGQGYKIDTPELAESELVTKFVPKAIDASTIDSAAKKYVDLKMFDVNGGLTQEGLDYTGKFFGPGQAKSVDQDVPTSQWADLSFLTQAVNELGQQ
jgi:hypothetical protein